MNKYFIIIISTKSKDQCYFSRKFILLTNKFQNTYQRIIANFSDKKTSWSCNLLPRSAASYQFINFLILSSRFLLCSTILPIVWVPISSIWTGRVILQAQMLPNLLCDTWAKKRGVTIPSHAHILWRILENYKQFKILRNQSKTSQKKLFVTMTTNMTFT